MLLSTHADNPSPFLTWQRITDWAQEHYRCRSFNKDERIPTRPGLLYLVERGAVRLVGTSYLVNEVTPGELDLQEEEGGEEEESLSLALAGNEEAFLGFVGAGQPFEVVAQPPFNLQSYAHVDQTTIVWLY
ncbi:MAG: Crp/Fnr family transcriptional regulator, partial [Nodosilinea sp.]